MSDLGFRAIAITASHDKFWVSGVGETIASSKNGQQWNVAHRASSGGATLVGIEFPTETFGYAYGTGGTLLTTEDGGNTWTSSHLGEQSILLASFSDPTHGLYRTSQSLYYLDGGNSPHEIAQPADILKRFSFTPFLVALSPTRMAALLSEGPHSEAGFLATNDGGKSWTFYDPPSTTVGGLLRVDAKYWTVGTEVLGKDKPGGGGAVPLAMSSGDGLHWAHTNNEIHPCHWESCTICTVQGCLASSTLLVDFFHQATTYRSIPKGNLTAKWAVNDDLICTLHTGLYCAPLGRATDVEAIPTVPKPLQPSIPRLGTPSASGALRCMSCDVEHYYVDEKMQGQFRVHISLKVRTDGTMEEVVVSNAPNELLRQKIHDQMMEWLFEPPTRDGQPVRVSTQTDIAINVIRSK